MNSSLPNVPLPSSANRANVFLAESSLVVFSPGTNFSAAKVSLKSSVCELSVSAALNTLTARCSNSKSVCSIPKPAATASPRKSPSEAVRNEVMMEGEIWERCNPSFGVKRRFAGSPWNRSRRRPRKRRERSPGPPPVPPPRNGAAAASRTTGSGARRSETCSAPTSAHTLADAFDTAT